LQWGRIHQELAQNLLFFYSFHNYCFLDEKKYKNTKKKTYSNQFFTKSMFSSIHNFLLKIDVFVAFLIFYG